MSVPLDQPVRLTFNTYSDPAETVPADPTAITLDILDPAGVTTTHNWTGDIVRDSIGVFHFDVTPATAGHYSYHWKATGAVTTALDGSFDVEPKYGAWLPLSAAKAQLNIPATDVSNDAELTGFIDAAVEIVEGLIGPVTSTTYTDSFTTDTTTPWPFHYSTWPRYTYYAVRAIDLRHTPVLSVQSVTVSSMDGTNPTTLAAGSYRFDPVTGSVTVIDGSPFGPLVTVAYTAGRANIPAAVRLAALLLVQHLWQQTQRGSSTGRPVPGAEPDADLSYGPSAESQAMALLERYRPAATIA